MTGRKGKTGEIHLCVECINCGTVYSWSSNASSTQRGTHSWGPHSVRFWEIYQADWLQLQSLALAFPVSDDLYQLLLLPLSIASWSCLPLPFPPLLLRLLLHFASDRGSGLCADCGWLEHCAVHWGSRNLSPCALNVPLEQQFLWGEIMRWASVKGSGGGGGLSQGRKERVRQGAGGSKGGTAYNTH